MPNVPPPRVHGMFDFYDRFNAEEEADERGEVGCSEVYAEWPGSAGRGMQGRSPASPGVF